MGVNILTSTTRVEAPFIQVDIGGYLFGAYSKKTTSVVDEKGFTRKYIASYPNYITNLTVNKVNGTVNTYTIQLVYAVQTGEDPNRIDKILGRVAKTRKINIVYGDYNAPNYIYKDTGALITNVTSTLDTVNSRISYVINATSAAKCLSAGIFNFNARKAKPSDVIKELISKEKYGLLDVFYGMRDYETVISQNLIAGDDKEIQIPAKSNISVFDYLNYLVNSMSANTDKADSLTGKHRYILTMSDDTTTNIISGPYFKVTKIATTSKEVSSIDTFEVDIGYPSRNIVTKFNVNDNQAYALLYEYSENIKQPEYSYVINDKGDFEYIYAPVLSNSKNLYISTEADKNWWSRVTQYPITATLELKGLLRPAMLATYIKVNVLFYGQKHNSSGLYMITSQQDSVGFSGYTTTLGLTRISGDEI